MFARSGDRTPWTHLVTSSFPPDCLWCEGTGICGLDVMTLKVLFIRPIEPSFFCPTFPAREPSPAIPAARTASRRGGAAARSRARHLHPPGSSVPPTCRRSICAVKYPGRKGGVYREAATQLDPTGAQDRPTTRRRDRCLGGRSIATGTACRLRPWLTVRPRRCSACGFKPSEIVWRRKRWPALIACSCRHRCGRWPTN